MTETITRADLADAVYQEVGLSHAESSEIVDSVFEEIRDALDAEGQVKISSFGTFAVREKSQRIGRNPKTKEEAVISARKVVTFHASNILVDRVNKQNSGGGDGGSDASGTFGGQY